MGELDRRLQQRYKNFCTELRKLSLKYDIAIQSVGGVFIYDEGYLVDIKYDPDLDSGDLTFQDKVIDD